MIPWDGDPYWAKRQGVKQCAGLVFLWAVVAVIFYLLFLRGQ